MQWIETTGRTLEEAKDAALDTLGVAEDDAEFEVLSEGRTGLFGRVRDEARVRARVRPKKPQPKVERSSRRRPRDRKRTARSDSAAADSVPPRDRDTESPDATTPAPPGTPTPPRQGSSRRRRRRGGSGDRPPQPRDDRSEENVSTITQQEQGRLVTDYLEGLLDAFDLDGEVAFEIDEDDIVRVEVTGDELGALIGPRGQVLVAVQELARTAVQHATDGARHGRFTLDIGGYRAKRRAALAEFATKLAADVVETGVAKALEPMAPPDRKVVHDTVNAIAGVSTRSEGEEPRRRVVIAPDAGDDT